MVHPEFDQELAVGVVCAGNMEQDYELARQRERRVKNVAMRRRRWLSRKWRVSKKGNPYLNTDRCNIVVFNKGSYWAAQIHDEVTGKNHRSKRHYQSERHARLGAFEAFMELLRRRQG